MTLKEAFLIASLTERENEMRLAAKNCRRAYSTEPMKGYCEILADAYAEAAKVFAKAKRGAKR